MHSRIDCFVCLVKILELIEAVIVSVVVYCLFLADDLAHYMREHVYTAQ